MNLLGQVLPRLKFSTVMGRSVPENIILDWAVPGSGQLKLGLFKVECKDVV